jgi:transglutaminase/protease-like cytokinesis protein 3
MLYVTKEFNIKLNFYDIQRKLLNNDAITTKEELTHEIRSAMLDYRSKVTIKYIGSYDDIKDIVEKPLEYVSAIDDEDTSSDFDYLKYIIREINVSIKGYANILELSYSFSYRETQEQTKAVDKKVKEVLKELDIDNLSDYEKVKEIHDYIVNNAAYDLSYQYVTAYDNLIEKTSVCQGYAALTYKMMTEASIPCRVISGMAGGQTHAWNIVYINGVWYNIDTTWDDPITDSGEQTLLYKYFLKSEEVFEQDHIRDKEYQTKKFLQDYPVSSESFVID